MRERGRMERRVGEGDRGKGEEEIERRGRESEMEGGRKEGERKEGEREEREETEGREGGKEGRREGARRDVVHILLNSYK